MKFTIHIIFVIASTMLVLPSIQAQSFNSKIVEQQTASHYLNKEWKNVIEIGKKALASNIDYYNLRYRLGIAYYELKDYNKAILHLNKAMTFNSNDEWLKVYLHFAYKLVGRSIEAQYIANQLSVSTRKETGITNNLFLYTEGGAKISNDSILGNTSYLNLGIGHQLGNQLQLYHAFTRLEQPSLLESYNQLEYYLSSKIYLSKGWVGNLSFHYIDANVTTDLTNEPEVEERRRLVESKGLVGFVGITKHFSHFSIMPAVAYAVFDNQIALQSKYLLTLPPSPSEWQSTSTFNNLQEVWQIGGTATWRYTLNQQPISVELNAFNHHQDSTNTLILKGAASIFLTDKLNLQVSYLKSGVTNTIEDNGAIVQNAQQATNQRYELLATYYLNKRLSLYGVYQYEDRLGTLEVPDFHFNTFLLGLKINL